MRPREIFGGTIAVACFAGAIYCALWRGDICFNKRKYDLEKGRTVRLYCKQAGPSYGTPREDFWTSDGIWLLWFGAAAGGYLFTWDERRRPPKR